MDEQRTYPHGVPCWVDAERPDPQGASAFYGDLFGWEFHSPADYLIATLDGRDVAGIGASDGRIAWNTYIAVDDADESAAAVRAAGGAVLAAPHDVGPGGRTATCADPAGAEFRLWQPRRRPGAQLVNVPGSWNFSNLRTADPIPALAFYQAVFGWVFDDPMGMVRVAGYGDHLARTVDPDIYQRQAAASPGFADVIAGVEPAEPGEATHWRVKFTVADRDASAEAAQRLGATVKSVSETLWTREAALRDPQGAEFTISQFTPPA